MALLTPSPPAHANGSRVAWIGALVLSATLFALRWSLAGRVGFGDAEALYAAYALHPQPAYLDHPGLIGVIARWIGHGGAPTPLDTHRFTAVAATLIPWLGLLSTRPFVTRWSQALPTVLALSLWPELSIGLFALTPDLPLAAAWLATLGLVGLSLASPPRSRTALGAAVLAGFFMGTAILAKASGALLLAAVVATYLSRPARDHLKSAAPWCGFAVALILVVPLVRWELHHDLAMLRHRFVATQGRAGVSLRNLGALLGGQLLYVTPPLLLGAFGVLRSLIRREGPLDRLLVCCAVVPGIPLALLCAWSRVAEPHWLAPAYLSLALGASRVDTIAPRLARLAIGMGLAAAAAGFLTVATPLVPRLSGPGYVPRYDLVNDLYVWEAGLPILREELEALDREGKTPIVVGPHWTVCAQVHAALGSSVHVGCVTPVGDDFGLWFPERAWLDAETLLYVTDDRFAVNPATALPRRDVTRERSASVVRGGRVVRTIRVDRLDRDTVAQTRPTKTGAQLTPPRRPAEP